MTPEQKRYREKRQLCISESEYRYLNQRRLWLKRAIYQVGANLIHHPDTHHSTNTSIGVTNQSHTLYQDNCVWTVADLSGSEPGYKKDQLQILYHRNPNTPLYIPDIKSPVTDIRCIVQHLNDDVMKTKLRQVNLSVYTQPSLDNDPCISHVYDVSADWASDTLAPINENYNRINTQVRLNYTQAKYILTFLHAVSHPVPLPIKSAD